jgi:uncharacterized membrane protein
MSISAALTCGALTWLTLLVASPLALSRGQVPGVTFAVYRAGAIVCHQRPERSFHLAGVQLPVCARCFGLYLSGALGLTAGLGLASRARRALSGATVRQLLALAALPIAVSVGVEWLGLIQTTNVQRMLTGLPLGFAAGVVIVRALVGPRRVVAI